MMPVGLSDEDRNTDLLTPGEVALLLRVDPRTVSRWARAGRIPSIRTLGGHRRFRRSDLAPYLSPETEPIHE